MKNRRVLVVGTGIAGPTLAYWLKRYGFRPTLVERATQLRGGGYVIDFWGAGYDVADRMGLLPALRRHALQIDAVRIVDDKGRRKGGFGKRAVRALLGGERYMSLLRSDLAREIYAALGDDVPTLFGETPVRIDQDDAGVFVEFRRAPAQHFDLVIGAGGLHSPVRQLLFGAESSFEKFLGYYVASFAADDYPHRDPHAYVGYSIPGRQLTRYTLQDGRTVFLLVFAASKLDIRHGDIDAQKNILRREFDHAGWEWPEIERRLANSDELYFDAVSQIRMPRWSRERAVLVGDACACPSLLAGQGAALAMVGAYVLAGELWRAGGDHSAAFAAYERALHPFITAKQDAAKGFARAFVPSTKFGIFVRDQVTRLMSVPLVADLAAQRMFKDAITLPAYEVH